MLLRAGFIYILSVLTVLLGGFAAWQHLDVSVRSQNAAALSQRIIVLQNDLNAVSRREEAAIRRASVAEDSLMRNETYSSSDAGRLNETREQLANAQREIAASEEARVRFEADLAQAIKERDQIRIERDELQRVTDEARVAADKTLLEADAARQQRNESKKAAPEVTAAKADAQLVVISPDVALAAPPLPAPEAAAAPIQLVRPAAEASASDVNEAKTTLVPNAVTIEPVPKSEKRDTPKRVTAKSEPRRAAISKPSTGSSGAVKKAPKQAKKDEPFFPF